MKKRLMKSAGVIGVSTLMSRCLGLVRDIVSARAFGTSWQWDAFLYAFMIPNFFRRLVGEGALSSAFIPIYKEILEKEGRRAAQRFSSAVLSFLLVGLLSLFFFAEVSLTLVLKTQVLSSRVELMLELLQCFFPYLILISLFALGMGILNSHGHFFIPSFAPVLLNIFWIVGVVWIVPQLGSAFSEQLKALAWILVVAGVFQVGSEVPMLLKYGVKFNWNWDLENEGLRRAGRLLLPALVGFAVMQINMLIDMSLAFFLGPGANSSLWYGTRLMQFPLGIFAIGMGTALLPMISEQAAKKDWENMGRSVSFALRILFFIIVPASIGLIVLAKPIVKFLFERGEFDAISTARSATVLICYSIGLFAFSGQKVMTAGFHATQDTKMPVKIGVIALTTNVILNLILMIPLREAGLALATSISGMLQFGLLFIFYRRHIVKVNLREILNSFTRILVSALLMGGLAFLCYRALDSFWADTHSLHFFLKIVTVILISIASYVLLCFVFRVHEVRDLLKYRQK